MVVGNNKSSENNCLKKAFLATIPVMAGYVVLGIGFGMLLRARGYGVFWAFAMSLFIYAGSMQYVAIDLMSGDVILQLAEQMEHLWLEDSLDI